MKRNIKLIAFCSAFLLSISVIVQCAYGATRQIRGTTIEEGKQFSLKNMPYNGKYCPIPRTYLNKSLTFRTVQNFAYTPDNKYIFTVSEAYSGAASEGVKHTLLTRCSIPNDKGELADADFKEATILKNYGHGESIAISQPDINKTLYYIWVACTPNKDKKTRFGTNIARLTYVVDSSGKGKITKRVIINNFVKAGVVYKSGKSVSTYLNAVNGKNATVNRVNVAVNESCNKIAFRVEYLKGQGTYYVVYDYKKLNYYVDKVANGKIYNINKAASLQKAYIRCGIRPLGSYQSFDIDNKKIYMCGGALGKGSGIYAIQYKTNVNGRPVLQKKDTNSSVNISYNIKTNLYIENKQLGDKDLEIEGMKIRKEADGKTYFYVNYFMNNVSIRDNIGIYKFR